MILWVTLDNYWPCFRKIIWDIIHSSSSLMPSSEHVKLRKKQIWDKVFEINFARRRTIGNQFQRENGESAIIGRLGRYTFDWECRPFLPSLWRHVQKKPKRTVGAACLQPTRIWQGSLRWKQEGEIRDQAVCLREMGELLREVPRRIHGRWWELLKAEKW